MDRRGRRQRKTRVCRIGAGMWLAPRTARGRHRHRSQSDSATSTTRPETVWSVIATFPGAMSRPQTSPALIPSARGAAVMAFSRATIYTIHASSVRIRLPRPRGPARLELVGPPRNGDRHARVCRGLTTAIPARPTDLRRTDDTASRSDMEKQYPLAQDQRRTQP